MPRRDVRSEALPVFLRFKDTQIHQEDDDIDDTLSLELFRKIPSSCKRSNV